MQNTNGNTNNEHEIELLNFAYRNVKMGLTGINQLRTGVKDKAFADELNREYNGYDGYSTELEERIKAIGGKTEDINPLAKAGSFMSNAVNTAVDSTVSHFAEMMIQGTDMGVVKLLQKLACYTDVPSPSRSIAERIVRTEEDNITKLKAFL